jgi:hypothetical protein
MPKVICAVHGQQLAPHACRHLARRVWEQEPLGRATYIDFDGLMAQGWLCDSCLARKEVQPFRECPGTLLETASEEDYVRLVDLIDFQPVCPNCFELFVQSHG